MPRKKGRGSRAEKRVADLYKKAGYSIKRNVRSRVGEIDIIATRNNQKWIIEVKSGKQKITSKQIKKLVNKAKYHHGKPVLRHSSRSSLTKVAKKFAKKYNVRVKKY